MPTRPMRCRLSAAWASIWRFRMPSLRPTFSPHRYELAAHDDELASVQKRREFPTRATQRMQIAVQNNVIKRVLGSSRIKAPWILKLFDRWSLLQRILARLIGMGFRPEHVKTPDAQSLR